MVVRGVVDREEKGGGKGGGPLRLGGTIKQLSPRRNKDDDEGLQSSDGTQANSQTTRTWASVHTRLRILINLRDTNTII